MPLKELLTKNGVLTEKITSLLSLLSKPDAFRIFILARNGIKSQVDTHSKIGLSKKQYYTRLSQLVSADLLVKEGNVYKQTMFGEIVCCDYLLRLGIEIMNSNYMEMIDVIRHSSRFGKEDIDMITSKIRQEIGNIK